MDLVTKGTDDPLPGHFNHLKIGLINLDDGEIGVQHGDGGVAVLDKKIRGHLFKDQLLLQRLESVAGEKQVSQQSADVMIHNPYTSGAFLDEFQQDAFAIGEFNDTVQLGNAEKIPEIIGGVNTPLACQPQTLGLGVDITNPHDLDVQEGKGIFFEQLKEKLTCPAAAHNGQVQFLPHAGGKLPLFRCHGAPFPMTGPSVTRVGREGFGAPTAGAQREGLTKSAGGRCRMPVSGSLLKR